MEENDRGYEVEYCTPPQVKHQDTETDQYTNFREDQVSTNTPLQVTTDTPLPGTQALQEDIAVDDLARQLVLLQQLYQHTTRTAPEVPSPTQVCPKYSMDLHNTILAQISMWPT